MSDGFVAQKIRHIAGLEEAPQNAPPPVTQRPEHGWEVASGQVSRDAEIGPQDRPAVTPEIQISDRSAHPGNLDVHRFRTWGFGGEDPQRAVVGGRPDDLLAPVAEDVGGQGRGGLGAIVGMHAGRGQQPGRGRTLGLSR